MYLDGCDSLDDATTAQFVHELSFALRLSELHLVRLKIGKKTIHQLSVLMKNMLNHRQDQQEFLLKFRCCDFEALVNQEMKHTFPTFNILENHLVPLTCLSLANCNITDPTLDAIKPRLSQ